MAVDPRGAPNQGWKGGARGERRRERDWQREPTAGPKERHRMSWRARVGLAFGSFLVVLAALGFLIWLLRPTGAAALVRQGAEYDPILAIPVNVSGWRSLDAFQEAGAHTPKGLGALWGGDKSIEVTDKPAEPIRSQDDLTKAVARPKRKTVVVYLALQGAADSGGPYVLAEGARDGERLRLEDLAKALRSAAKDKTLVLALDSTHVVCSWPLGILANDFAGQLQARLSELVKKDPKLVFLCASAPGQRSWVSQKWGQTAFAHYLAEGLRGRAAPDDGVVTVQKLYEYVRRQVNAWTSAARNVPQEPLLVCDKNADLAHMYLAAVDPHTPPAHETAEDLPNAWNPSLDAEWKDHDRLRMGAPWVNAPALWHKYEDTLLRYEQVLRARGGEQVTASTRDQLTTLKAALQRPFYPDASAFCALPMPAVLGRLPASARADEADFLRKVETLWQAGRSADAKRIGDAVEALRGADRGRLASALLERVAQATDHADIKLACELFPKLGLNGAKRPAEVNFLAMLYADLDREEAAPRLPAAEVAHAVRVRLLAEKAALAGTDRGAAGHAEQIVPWVKERVDEADVSRRRGEDYLLLSTDEDWAEAKKRLTQAEQLYQQAFTDGSALREAMALRDRVFADLPYYSRWLAGAREADVNIHVEETEKLWDTVHELADLLEKPGPDRIERIKRASDSIKRDFGAVDALFQTQCTRLADSGRTPSEWRDIEHVLSVPLIPHALRQTLVAKSREIAQEHEPTGELDTRKDAKPASAADAERTVEEALLAGRRQGRMALAALGKRMIEQEGGMEGKRLDRLREQLRDADWAKLAELGEIVRQDGWALADRLDKQFGPEIHKALAADQAAIQFAGAEDAARHLDGAAVSDAAVGAVHEGRRLQLARLLSWQAERVARDFWMGDGGDPFYRTAARAYLDDAREALKASTTDEQIARQRQAPEQKLAARLDTPARLRVEPVEKQMKLTSQQVFDVKFMVQADPGVEPGSPARVLRPGKFKPAGSDNPTRRSPFELPLKAGQPELTFALRNNSLSELQKVDLEVHYRGRRIPNGTSVYAGIEPDFISYRQEPDPEARIAAKATNDLASDAAVGIVLDWSGSMNDPDRSGKKKVEAAREAIEQVLRKIPNGVKVGVWIFSRLQTGEDPSHATDAWQTDRKNSLESLKNTKVEVLRAPKPWNGMSEAGSNELRDLVQLLNNSTPVHHTPLVEAIMTAAEGIKDAPGARAVIVLTDGHDDCFADPDYIQDHPNFENQYNPDHRFGKGDIARFFKDKFGKSDSDPQLSQVAINMILFGKQDSDDMKQAVKQFKNADGLSWVFQTLPIPGTVMQTEYGTQLPALLEDFLRPRLRVRYDEGEAAPVGVPEKGLAVAFPYELDHPWSVSLDTFGRGAGGFRIMPRRMKDQRLLLGAGERMLLDFTSKGLKRGLYAREVLGKDDSRLRQEGNWLLGVLQNQNARAINALEMLVTAEEKPAEAVDPEEVIRHHRPEFIWFNIDGKPMWVSERPQYPAPAWTIRVPDWPENTAPALQVWRGSKPEGKEMAHQPNSSLSSEFGDLGGGVRIEVRAENETVHPDGLQGGTTQPCLVVRARYPHGNPVFVELQGDMKKDLKGMEQRVYSTADQYTACFWPVKPDQAERVAFSLLVYRLDEAKKAGAHTTFALSVPDTKPAPSPVPPLPAGK